MKRIIWSLVFFCVLLLYHDNCSAASKVNEAVKRQIFNLNGTWKIQKGGYTPPVLSYTGEIPVPGTTNLAKNVSGAGNYWWYQREFILNTKPTEVAMLKLNKARYGTVVFINGKKAGELYSCFGPQLYDVKQFLNFNDVNVITIRIGLFSNFPKDMHNGNELESRIHISGIYDDVSMILCNTPVINTVQTNPRSDGTLEIKVNVSIESDAAYEGPVEFIVRRLDNNKIAGKSQLSIKIPSSGSADVTTSIAVQDCHFWSPETPFLYTLTTKTSGDERTDRFGMRTFQFDPVTKRPILNGRPYHITGTNSVFQRLIDDTSPGSCPWDKEWVRKMIRTFKSLNYNGMRNHHGPPPDFWYDIFDEEGFMIQEEYAIWTIPDQVSASVLARDVTPWIYQHCNHPCIFVWDMCDETPGKTTGEAIKIVRNIDIQGRRWENGTKGWNEPVAPEDPYELHLYPFLGWQQTPEFFNEPDATINLEKHGLFNFRTLNQFPNPRMICELGWLWITRDGLPTRNTYHHYEFLTGGGLGSGDYGTEADRRYIRATYTAMNTEYFRNLREVDIIFNFDGISLSFSNPENPEYSCATSDCFLEPISALNVDPYFKNYIRDACAPIGMCIERYNSVYKAGSIQKIPVSVFNDTYRDWKGEIRFFIVRGGSVTSKKDLPAVTPVAYEIFNVPADKKITKELGVTIPQETGDYTLIAEYGEASDKVQCVRDFVVGKPPRWIKNYGPDLALNKPVKTSSVIAQPVEDKIKGQIVCSAFSGNYEGLRAVDGNRFNRWVSSPGNDQWIEVDLQKSQELGSILLVWSSDRRMAPQPATEYTIEVSDDEKTWMQVVKETKGGKLHDNHWLKNVSGRYIRITSQKAANPDLGISLCEIEVYPPQIENLN